LNTIKVQHEKSLKFFLTVFNARKVLYYVFFKN
jgi:hypothetical protein